MHLLLARGMSMLVSLSLAETVIASLVHCSHPSDWKNQWSKRPQRARPDDAIDNFLVSTRHSAGHPLV